MSRPIRILIVEPSAIVAEGLLSILSAHADFHCLRPLQSPQTMWEYVRQEKPDLLIVNPTLFADLNDLSALSLPVVALIYQYVERYKWQRFDAVLDIRENPQQIPVMLKQLLAQEKDTRNDVALDENYELSDREIDVLKWVAQGLMNKEIADKLNISVHTVISHRKNINRKTGIKSVAGLTVYAIMKGYIASV